MAFIDRITFGTMAARRVIVFLMVILGCFVSRSFGAETIGYVWPKQDLLVPDNSNGKFVSLQFLSTCPLVKKTDKGWLILWEGEDGNPRLALIPFFDALGNPTVDLNNSAPTSRGTMRPYGPENPLVTLKGLTGVAPKPAYVPLEAGARYPVVSQSNGNYLVVYTYSALTYAFTQTVVVARVDCSYASVADFTSVVKNLVSGAETAISTGASPEQVAASFINYQGRFADETAKERGELAKQYADKAKAHLFEAAQAAKGLVSFQGEWMPKFEAEQRAKGLVKLHEEWITPEERDQRLAEEARAFEAGQKAKGLVKYGGRWMTPTEAEQAEVNAREQEFVRQADKIVMSKRKADTRFRVFQAVSDGALCEMLNTGETFFLLGVTSAIVADGELYRDDLYWAGTYTYTTRMGTERTVNSYSYSREIARTAVRDKFGLYDQGKTRTTSGVGEESRGVEIPSDIKGFGTGFFITDDGYLVTNNHVVKKAKAVKVRTESATLDAKVIAQDAENDVALLKVIGTFSPVTFSPERAALLGQTIFTLGFPMPDLQGFSPKVTKGVISSLRGLRDNVREYQIDASVQPGNSGGPLSDEAGNVVGVVVARLNDAAVIESTGAIPQNVNYAVKKSYILALLDSYPEVTKKLVVGDKVEKIPLEDAVSKVKKSTVLIAVY